MWVGALALLASFAAGCAPPQAFVPVEHVTGLSPEGNYFAAEYTIDDAGARVGEAKVWSEGAYREEIGGDTETLVHVGIQLESTGDAALHLDETRLALDQVTLEDGSIDRLTPLRVTGETDIAPGTEQRIDVLFVMPEDVWPTDVLHYRIVWAVTNGGTYVQKTPFRARARRSPDPYWMRGYGWPPYDGWAPYPYYDYPPLWGPRVWPHRHWPVVPRHLSRPRPR